MKTPTTPLEEPRIIYECNEWWAIYKPSFWHSLQGKDEGYPSLEGWIRKKLPEGKRLPEGGLLHRLDFLTSGLMIAAKSKDFLEKTQNHFRQGQSSQKFYLAIVSGQPKLGYFDFYFHSRYKGSKKIQVLLKGTENERGRCQFQILKTETEPPLSLLEVEILGPGRRHQIRAGLAHLGHPILGDPLYGPTPEGPQDALPVYFGLHAWRLEFSGQSLLCPPPPTWPQQFTHLGP